MPGADASVLVNWPDWIGEPIIIGTIGVGVQGPNIIIPDGVPVLFAARGGNSGNIFFQKSQNLVLDANRRLVMGPGTTRTFYVTNANLFWWDAATANDVIEVMIEQGVAGRTGVNAKYA